MTDQEFSDEELESEALAYIYGETDFSGLPVMQPGPLDVPEDHPDKDPLRPVPPIQSDEDFRAELAEMYEQLDRIAADRRRAA